MINKKLTFILMKTKDTKVGALYMMTHSGGKVISRKSMNRKIEYKKWEKETHRVKTIYPESSEINPLLERTLVEFQMKNMELLTMDDKLCSLVYMRQRISQESLSVRTKKKYYTIVSNFEKIVFEELKMKSLPFSQLRDIQFIRLLQSKIRKNGKTYKGVKTNNGVFNYMSVFTKYVKEWNMDSGTQFPINVLSFTRGIGKDPKKLVEYLTHDELTKLSNFVPFGKKKGEPQRLSKNLFLFQYHTGGVRIQDALILTNKDIKPNGFQIKIHKTKQVEIFPFCYEQVDCLMHYYSAEYISALEQSKVGKLNLNCTTILKINQLEGIGDISIFGLKELTNLKNEVIKLSIQNKELDEYLISIIEIEEELKNKICDIFFELLKNKPKCFLFPKLNWDDFKEIMENKDYYSLSEEHIKIIHCAEAGHNSNLKRIAKELGISSMSGHTPRHTLANHLLAEGYTEEQIQKVLIHSSVNTTKIYLNERHSSNQVNKTLLDFKEKMRIKNRKLA